LFVFLRLVLVPVAAALIYQNILNILNNLNLNHSKTKQMNQIKNMALNDLL